MASSVPPAKGVAYSFQTSLVSQADTKLFQSSPTLAAGDVKVIRDGTNLGNITTLPSAVSGVTKAITVSLSATEMNGDEILVMFSDAAGAEWCDLAILIETSERSLDTGVKLADGVAHGGTPGSSTATLAMKHGRFTNDSGVGLWLESAGGDSNGLYCKGDDTSAGISSTGGTNGGAGLELAGGSTSGPAMKLVASEGHGLEIYAAGTGKHDIALSGSGTIWDSVNSTYVTANAYTLTPIRTGTAQAGASSSITLDASASSVSSFYNGQMIRITGGTGVGQVRVISTYNSTTKVATTLPSWRTNPDNTSTFAILPFGPVNIEAIGGSAAYTASGIINANVMQVYSDSDAAGYLYTLATHYGAAGVLNANLNGTINGLTAVALKDFFDTDSTTTYASSVAGSVVKEIVDNVDCGGSGGGSSGGNTITIVGAPTVDEDNTIELIQGDDYYNADGRAITFTLGASPDLTGSTVVMRIETGDDPGDSCITSTTGTLVSVGGVSQSIRFEFATADTSDLVVGKYLYDVSATLSNGHIVTLVRGYCDVLEQAT